MTVTDSAVAAMQTKSRMRARVALTAVLELSVAACTKRPTAEVAGISRWCVTVLARLT
jgi:hypothetical protein